ncbi:MAG: phosphogluconate dehydrogenase (NAD(+)-dependent, decarboxylating), partial [Candidatus Paceibacteria bacterium]
MHAENLQKNTDIPTILVVFGATGDLMAKKIVPSLFHLFQKNKLPRLFKIIGFSRQELSDKTFRKSILQTLSVHKDIPAKTCEEFCELFSYQQGVFQEKEGYKSLSKTFKQIDDVWGVCSNKLFYLAVPPQFYEIIFKNLANSGLTKPCHPEEGWTPLEINRWRLEQRAKGKTDMTKYPTKRVGESLTGWSRVLVEKPFGKDLATAQKLEKLLSSLFKEIQIYRIDHYLAKEMVQNILAFRFSNNLFEKTWDKNSIEKIEIKLWEKIGVEDRGSFYDGLGALRDVGQNHLLQILALLTMEHPINFSSEAIRKKRSETLKTLIPPSDEEIKKHTFRAQYKGYKNIRGVNPNSSTETYFKIRAYLSHPRWAGVPFILESGKRIKEQIKEAVITFRHPAPCLCSSDETHYKNKITIALEPEEKITFTFWSKKPGLKFELQERDFSFLMRGAREKIQYTEEYEKLLYDCIIGDQTLFVTSNEVEAMWKYIDQIIKVWQKNKVSLEIYEPNTNQPIIESALIAESIKPLPGIKKEIGIVGLGKMGGNIARRLMEKGWRVYGYDRTPDITKSLEKEGVSGAYSLKDIIEAISPPRLIWLMVPAGKPVDEVLFGKNGLVSQLTRGDVVIDGGNSFFKDSIRRFEKLKKLGIHFVDVGVSGGPAGARYGAALMIGGEKSVFQKIEPLLKDLAQENGYQFFEGPGAGHFVKMIHNGIEYGMMQAIAEGFTVLKNSKYNLSLEAVADVYNHGSVIESRLIEWLRSALKLYGENLDDVSGLVGHTGEGEWTIKVAKEMKIKTKVIEEALKFRINSEKNPDYTGKILSALREQFGGHKI